MTRQVVAATDPPTTAEHACDCCGARYYGRGVALQCCATVLPDGGEVEDERPRTRTVEREEVNVETVEEEELLCPVCEQWYDEEEMVPVGLGVDEDDTQAHHRAYFEADQLCRSCSESLFGYDGPAGVFDYIGAEWRAMDWRDLLSGAGSVALTLGSGAAVLHGFGYALDSIDRFMREPAAQDAATDVSLFGPITDVLGPIVPMIVALWILVFLARMVTMEPL